MKLKLITFSLLIVFYSCSSEKENKISSFAVIEKGRELYKEIEFTQNGKLIQKIDSIGGTNWNRNTDTFDTKFYVNSITWYTDTANSLIIKYINDQPSAIFQGISEKKDTLFFNYPLNYNSYVSLKQSLSWNDPVVQNGVELLVKNCATCHIPRLMSHSTIQSFDTTNISTFRQNIRQIHTDSFADSIINTISDREFNSVRKIIKNAVREPQVVY